MEWSIGRAIEIARRLDEQTQGELAAALESHTGVHWDASKVSRTETGKREPTWGDVLALAEVQGRPLEWYQRPPKEWRNGHDPHQSVLPFRRRAG